MKKNSEVRIKTQRVRYQSGIQTGAGIVAPPPNLRFGGGAKTPII
ncbi:MULTISPECIES: hypothetical protein [unclassified Nostoc]|nr:hypothetical protein [Nostoc sp. KVJ20]